MTKETKLREVLEAYHDHMSMIDSKAMIDKQKIVERDDISRKQLYPMLLEVSMREIEEEDAEQNRAIARIISIMREEK